MNETVQSEEYIYLQEQKRTLNKENRFTLMTIIKINLRE